MEYATSPARPAGRGRIRFRHVTPLAPAEVQPLLFDLAAHLPIAPDEVEVEPSGHGSVAYGDDDTLTADELTQLVAWLRDHPRLRDVRWEPTVEK